MNPPEKNERLTWLWIWVGGAFALMLAAWTVFFVMAARHQVTEVPLETHAPH